tara:strand:+ start:486 stop:665 length:180 start_codon:yes stop_codon:yes gene_type:complete
LRQNKKTRAQTELALPQELYLKRENSVEMAMAIQIAGSKLGIPRAKTHKSQVSRKNDNK